MRFWIFLYALVSFPLFSQEYRGAITGAVSDPSGTGIPGATVTVTETNTQTKVTVTTESTGAYNASGLLPGDYEIHVTQPGFKDSTRRGIHLGAGARAVLTDPAARRPGGRDRNRRAISVRAEQLVQARIGRHHLNSRVGVGPIGAGRSLPFHLSVSRSSRSMPLAIND